MLIRQLGLRPPVAPCHLGLGTLHRQAGKRRKAEENLIIAPMMFREMDVRFWLELAEPELATTV